MQTSAETAQQVTFTVNGTTISGPVDGRQTLLRYLRDELGLLGTKDGCTSGDCGSCVVQVDGKTVDSCVFLMRRADSVRIETIEGLAREDGSLHPIQAAFLEKGAVQCGFCIPGMIMASKALLESTSSPTLPEIREGLKDNICRCTGFEPIFDAVQQAAEWIGNPASFDGWEPTFGPIGSPSVLVDGTKSVQGKLQYADDMVLPGMLHGAVVWSAHAYARLLGVDASAAKAAPGVRWVITADDVPGLNAHGRTVPDQPVFAYDYVRFTGDPIALVLADTREQAFQARDLVTVEYQPLEGLFRPADSLEDGAPQLVSSAPGNVCKALVHEAGDVEAAFASAAQVVVGHFTTQRQDHAYLEPLACLAEARDGGITLYVPQQAPFETREQLTKILDLPREKIRIVSTPLGGGFGGKLEIHLEGMAAVAAWVTRKPVKIVLPRGESLRTSVKRHPFELDYRVATDAEGRLAAVEAKMVCDGGPYTGNSPRVIDQACIFSCGPYRVPNVRVDGKAVLTNNPLGGAFRGYGINQAAVAMESLMDELAIKLRMDPFEFRRKNMYVEGDYTITGQHLPSSVGAVATLDACKEAFNEEWPTYQAMARPGYRVGFGVAGGMKNVGAGKGKIDDAGATFTLKPDGRIDLISSVVDMGQAIRTTMIQLAAQSTGIDFRQFDIITMDTAIVHPHRSASGQRQTLVSGNAVVIAGRQFKKLLFELVSKWTSRSAAEIALVDNEFRTQWTQYVVEEKLMTLAELYARAAAEGIEVKTEAEYIAPQTWPLSDQEARRTVPKDKYRNYPTYAYATQVAIVGVDEASGRVDLLRVIAAHDCGVAINPQQIRGQLIGSVSMGQGLALSENYPSVNGSPPWRRLDYRRLGVPTSLNATTVRTIIVEDPFAEGPYGAKGISEIATVPSTPAILNAIHNATGYRSYSTPVDPAQILRGDDRVTPGKTADTVTVVIASPLEPELIERIRDVDRSRLRVINEPGLIPRARYAADHDGNRPSLDDAALERWQSILLSADVLFDLDWRDPAALPENAPNVRWVQLSRSGVGESLGRLGLDQSAITFANAAGVHAAPLAEFVVLGLLWLLKDIPTMTAQQAEHAWRQSVTRTLAGRRILLVGLGGLGTEVARVLAALGVEIWGLRRSETPVPDGVSRAIRLADLHSSLGQVDGIVVACPYTAETHHLIGSAELAALPVGAFVVNIARGGVIDEAGLVAALESGHLGGAALDVFEVEPLPADSPLWSMPNVLVSPHRASIVEAENARIVDLFTDNLRRFLDGRPLRNVYERHRGY